MLIRSLCNTCFQVYEITILPEDAFLLKDLATDGLAPCPRLCGGQINLEASPGIEALVEEKKLRDPLSISMKELYKAVHGAGLPDEIPKSPEAVEAILRSTPIVRVKVEMVEKLIYLNEIELANGLTVHLTSGPRGATVLKITRKEL